MIAQLAAAIAAVATQWAGVYALPQTAGDVGVSVQLLRGGKVAVSLGSGHVDEATVAGRLANGRLRFTVPGRPPVVFDGKLGKSAITGTVRQGPLRGTFTLRPRKTLPDWRLDGLYDLADGRVISVESNFYAGRLGVEFDTGEVRRLYPRGATRFDIGAAIGVRAPVAGQATFAGDALTWTRGATSRGKERATRRLDVLFRSGSAQLAGTLTLPAGRGPFPAVAVVHGAGEAPRDAAGPLAMSFLRRGIAVLAYDKRGIGQSGGDYPGESANAYSIDIYARDAAAAARFLKAQPEIDDARIGLTGVSQAGWIMPLAASRERAIRFLVLFVAPTLTQGETDLFADLTGQGQSPPPRPIAEIEREVVASGPAGFDPMPSIRALRIPALWVFGGVDKTVPTRLSVAKLEPLTKEASRDFTALVFPRGAHSLLDTANGLSSEAVRSGRYVEGLFTTVGEWLAARKLAR